MKQLGNAEMLTMVGDGHTAFGGNSACIDSAVVAQIETLTLPPDGTVCQQEVPFVPPAAAPAATASAAGAARALARSRLVQPARSASRDRALGAAAAAPSVRAQRRRITPDHGARLPLEASARSVAASTHPGLQRDGRVGEVQSHAEHAAP